MAVARDISDVAGLDQALAEIVEQAALLTEADVVVARLRSDGAGLTARAVHASSAALQAELEGSRISADSLSADGADDIVQLSRPLRLVADKLGATAVLQLPIRVGDTLIGSLELMRTRLAPADTDLSGRPAEFRAVAVRLHAEFLESIGHREWLVDVGVFVDIVSAVQLIADHVLPRAIG